MYFSKKYVNQDDNYQLAKTIKERELESKKTETNINESSEVDNHINKINNAKINEHTRDIMRAKAYTSLNEAYFVRGLAKAYVKSLPLDEDGISESILIKYFEQSLHENVNISEMMLKNRKNNKFLNTLYEDSKYLAGKNCDKLAEKQDLTKESIDAFLNDNEEDDDKKIMNNNDFNENELCEIVKDKVIETVKQEQEYAKKIKDEDDEINELKEKNEDVRIETGIPQHSLFKSLMMASAKKNTLNENTNETALCDTICEYTRLELFNTLNISSHTSREIKNICESMLIDSDTSLLY